MSFIFYLLNYFSLAIVCLFDPPVVIAGISIVGYFAGGEVARWGVLDLCWLFFIYFVCGLFGWLLISLSLSCAYYLWHVQSG